MQGPCVMDTAAIPLYCMTALGYCSGWTSQYANRWVGDQREGVAPRMREVVLNQMAVSGIKCIEQWGCNRQALP